MDTWGEHPRRRLERGAKIALIAGAAMVVAVPAEAQLTNSVVSAGLQCGGEVYAFDGRGISYETAEVARDRLVNELLADLARTAPICSSRKVPGCRRLQSRLSAVLFERGPNGGLLTGGDLGRALLRAAGQLRVEADRVIAHAYCRAHARDGDPPANCRRLIAEELALAIHPGAGGAADALRLYCSPGIEFGESPARTAPLVEALLPDAEGVVSETSHDAEPVWLGLCSRAGVPAAFAVPPGVDIYEPSYVIEVETAPSRDSDAEPELDSDRGTSSSRRDLIRGALLVLAQAQAEPTVAVVDSEARCGAESTRAGGCCRDATIYINPAGMIRQNAVDLSPGDDDEDSCGDDDDDTPPTLCIDVTDFSMTDPFEVFLVRGAARSHVRALPGEVMTIPDVIRESNDPVLSVDVRGYARGRSLRALAAANQLLGNEVDDTDALVGTSDLFHLNRQVAREQAGRARERARGNLRREVRGHLLANASAASALDGFRALSAPSDAQVRAAIQALNVAARAALGAVSGRVAAAGDAELTAHWSHVHTALARVLASVRPPSSAGDDAAGVAARRASANQLLSVYESLLADTTASAAESREQTLRRHLDLLCELAAHPVRVVTHDLLVADTHPDDAVFLHYDFDHGYLPPANQRRQVRSDTPLFVQVGGVPPDSVIGLAVDGQPVAHTRREVLGLEREDANPAPTRTTQHARQQGLTRYLARLRSVVGMPGTQIFAVGRLEGARIHSVELCVAEGVGTTECGLRYPSGSDASPAAAAGNGEADESESTASAASTADAPRFPSGRRLANTSLAVHGEHLFGVRAGLGAHMAFVDPTRRVAVRDGAESNIWRVQEEAVGWNVGLPLLPTLYFARAQTEGDVDWGGRDILCDFGADCGLNVSFGVVLAGVDLIRPTEVFYPLGFVLDLSGVGLTLALTLQRVSTPRVAEGEIVRGPEDATQSPDLGAIFGNEDTFYPGGFIGITMDLDLFQSVYRELTKSGEGAMGVARAVGGL